MRGQSGLRARVDTFTPDRGLAGRPGQFSIATRQAPEAGPTPELRSPLRRITPSMADSLFPPTESATRRWAVALALLAVFMVLGGRELYLYESARAKDARYDSLAGIGHIKADLIAHWRQDKVASVERMSRRPLFREVLRAWEQSGFVPEERRAWEERLTYERRTEIPDSMIVATDAQRILATTRPGSTIPPESRVAIDRALDTGRGAMSEPFRTTEGDVRIDAVAPIPDGDGRAMAILLFRIDPDVYLHPLVRSWPTSDATAESLIVRREGDDVVFISPLRHWDGATVLRMPATRQDVLSVQAALGREGRLDGPDYRGMEVIADARAIGDSTWFLITKMDVSEIIGDATGRTTVVLLILGLLVLIAGGASAFIHHRRQSALFRHLYLSERQQREHREQFRTVLYSIDDGVITTDEHGRIEIMNPAAERLTGWAEHESRGRPLEDVFVARDGATRTPVANPVREVLRHNRTFKLQNEAVLVARDASERPIADSAAPIRGDDGGVCGAVLVFRDQSDERAAEQALRDSEFRFRQLADALPQLVWTAAPDGRVDFYNDRHREYAGIRSTPHGFEWEPVLHPEDVDPTIEAWTRAHQTGETYEIEHRVRRADGGFRWLLSRGVPVRNRDGAIVKWFGTATDVDDLKTAERALSESESRYRSLFENMNEAFAVGEIITDDSGKAVDVRLAQVNKAFQRETGLPNEVLDRPLKQLLPHFEQVWIETLAQVVETGQPATLTELSRDLGRYFEMFCFRPEPGKFSILFRDVTDRVRAEAALKRTLAELKRSNKDLEQFAFAASHDLKSPLRAIESLAQWIDEDLKDKLEGEPREHLRLLRQRARRMGRLLDDLLTYARAGTSGRVASVDVAQLLTQVRDFLAPSDGIRVQFDAPLPVLTTPVAPLRQVFTNLIGNAIKHHDRPTGLIHVSASDLDTFVEFCVEDDGPGIPLEFRKRVFEMFQTLRPRDEIEGSGMGLAIVRRIIESVGGCVTLSSAGARGTVVRFTWPKRIETPTPDTR